MAYGKTLEMLLFSKQIKYRILEPAEKKNRDRSLRGKDRIRARRRARIGG